MAQALLRDFVEEMRQRLSVGQYAEATTLGHHILCYYPKHLETYRLLAQVSLETGDPTGAADLFRRVLSADPENMVALAGLAVAHEQLGELPEALWHMERAFELQPNNPDLRSELRRLYGLIEGAPRGRLKLTPAALARLHARQGMFAQAIQEFRSILRTDPQRLDLETALVEALYREGHAQEAAQVAQSLLERLPYCLKANLVLGALLRENGAAEANVMLHRALAVDPERLVARELGIEEPGEAAPELPPLGEEAAHATPALLPLQPVHTPFEPAAPVAEPEDASEKPEEPATPEQPVDSQPAVQTGEGQAVVSEAPAQDAPPSLPQFAPTIPGALEKLPAWLFIDSTQVQEPTSAEETLLEVEATAPLEEPEAAPETEELTEAKVGATPQWLSETREQAEAPFDVKLPDWLIVEAEQNVRPPAERQVPEWLQLIESSPAEPEAAPTVQAEPEPPASSETVEPTNEAAAAPLEQLTGETGLEAATVGTPPNESDETISGLVSLPALGDEEIPDWLQVPAPTQADEGFPDWLRDYVQDETPAEATAEQPTAVEQAPAAEQPTATEAEAAQVSAEAEIEAEAELALQPPAEAQAEQAAARPAEPGIIEPTAEALAPTAAAETPAVEVAAAPQEAEAVEPQVSEAERLLAEARAARESGDLAAAIELYGKALERGPREVSEALPELEELAARADAPLPAHRLLGDAYSLVGRYKEALEQYRIVLGSKL